jgi:hypothetical protein
MIKKILLSSFIGLSLSAQVYNSSGTIVTYGVADDTRLITHTRVKKKPDDTFFGNITNKQVVKTVTTAVGYYAVGKIGDKMLSHDTRSAEYGAVGSIVGSFIPAIGPVVGGAIGVLAGGLKPEKTIPKNPYAPYEGLLK